jgi:RNA recognition motif-containing protein
VAKKLYVGNLPFSATDEELRNVFAAYNPTSVSIITDRDTGRSRGFAFVEVGDGDKAITEVNGADMGGRKLVVNEARERESRGPRQGGSGGGYRQDDRQGGGYNRRD